MTARTQQFRRHATRHTQGAGRRHSPHTSQHARALLARGAVLAVVVPDGALILVLSQPRRTPVGAAFGGGGVSAPPADTGAQRQE